ncbi:hypothetical protein XENOCAPTIV_006025, partial [Xenoophorus captivus]
VQVSAAGHHSGRTAPGMIRKKSVSYVGQKLMISSSFKWIVNLYSDPPKAAHSGLSQLSESLDSLERGFLLARDEHKLLQQTGVQTCHFDPERELEGLIFQCGLQMDELKEQDRIISPETDSGFVGSDSSHLTPAAVPILLHQRASESVSAPQDRNPMRPQSASLSLSHLDQEPTEGHTLDSNQRRRSRQRRRTFSYSPQSCISQKNQARADNGSSDSWMMSDAPSACEEQRSDPFSESVDSPLCANSSSPPPARHRHGHPLRVANPSHGGNYKDAFMKLRAEVEKLKEKLDISLRNEKPLSSVTAAPSAQKICFHHTPSPSIRSAFSCRCNPTCSSLSRKNCSL